MKRFDVCSGVVEALAAAVALVAVPLPASAQPDVSDRFGETVDVVVVGVEAVVTDRDGNRVPGLGADDFLLVVDGRETAVEYFSEIRDGQALERAPEAEAGQTPEGKTGQAPAPVASAARAVTNHLVFVDDFFAIRSHRNSVLKGLRDDLASLPAGDRMAVVAFDGEELDVLAPWTTSRDELDRAFERALRRPTLGLLRASERRRRGEEGPWTDSATQARELERVFTAVRSTLQVLPRPDGRKVLLLLGGGWPTNLFGLDPGGETPAERFWDSRLDDRGLAGALADAANLLGYTLYPVDVQGLRSRDVPVEREGTGPGAPDGGEPPGASPYTGELLRQDTLRYLAEETGGRALLFAERDDAFASVVADTRTYYSLGFTSHLRGDGSHHDIHLEARRPGLRVRARTGFRDVSRATELDLLVESALRLDAGEAATAGLDDDGSGLEVSLSEPRRGDRGTMEVTLTVDIPWSELTLLPGEQGLLARLEIRIAARDRRGELSEMAHVPLNVVRETPPPPGRKIRWASDLTLRRERHDLVVSVYDAVSGHTLTRKLTIEP